jgi:SAM-dependent methyltransferase
MASPLKRLERRLTAKLTREPLDRFLRQHASTAFTLDLGASVGFYAPLFPNRVSLDIRPAQGVQVVGDAHALCFPDATFDVVLCTEVLEHLVEPQRGIDEMRRVLRPGGTLLLTTRFLFPIHDAPGDYFRYTRYGLSHLLRKFDEVDIVEEYDAMGTLAVLTQRLALQTETLGWRPLGAGWHLLARLVRRLSFLTTAEYGDSLKTPARHPIMTSGYYVRAIRRADPDQASGDQRRAQSGSANLGSSPSQDQGTQPR